MRTRLTQLGIDPDRPRRPRLNGGKSDPTAAKQSAELEKLRDLRDRGTLTDEEYERARDRLRRY